MGMMTTVATDAAAMAAMPAVAYLDPLDADEPGDALMPATVRGLTRRALVAAETGARFKREEVATDPMAWLLAPRRLFGGAAAIGACLERDHCLRAVLLHGLSLGFDAAPAQVDALLADVPGDDGSVWDGAEPRGGGGEVGRRSGRRQRLYSAVIVVARGGELIHPFHASVAPASSVVRERIPRASARPRRPRPTFASASTSTARRPRACCRPASARCSSAVGASAGRRWRAST